MNESSGGEVLEKIFAVRHKYSGMALRPPCTVHALCWRGENRPLLYIPHSCGWWSASQLPQGCRSQYPLVPRTNTFFSISLKNTFSKCHQASKLIAMDSTMGVANCISLLHGACKGWETLVYKVLSSCLCFHTAQMHWHSELKKQGSFEKRPYYQLFHQLHKTPSKSPPTQKRFERVVHLQLERSAPTD